MADDSVVLDFLVQVDQARAELERFVRDSELQLEQLAKSGRTDIVVDVAQAKMNLDKLAAQLREFLAEANQVRVTKLNLDASQPLAQVSALEQSVRTALEEIASVGAASGPSLAPLEVAFRAATAAVDDFAARSQVDSESFGRGFQSAALEARVALEQLEAALLALREGGGGVTQADLERLLALREGYAQAVVGAGEFVETQAAVKRELAGEASALETAQLRLASYLALLEAAGGALTPLQVATRGLEGALLDLGARLSSTSANFGQGLPAAAQKAVAALAELRQQMAEDAASPGAVSEAQIAKVRELEVLYESLILRLREVQGASAQAGAATAATVAPVQGLGDKFRELAGYVNLYLATKIASEIQKLGTAALDAELAMERINARLLQASGSAKGAADELAFLRSAANTLGIPLRESAENFANLEISARQTNLTAAETRQLFVGLGAAAAGLRLPTAEATELYGRFADALSRGALDTRTLRQLADSMRGVMQELAVTFLGAGARVEDFRKAVTAGNVPIEDFVRQLAPLLISQYRDQLPEAVRSTEAELNRLKNSQFEFSVSLSQQFTPALREAIDRLREFSAENGNISQGFGVIGKGFLKGAETIALGVIGFVRLVESAAYGMVAAVTGALARIADGATLVFGKTFSGAASQLHAFTEALSDESRIAGDRLEKTWGKISEVWTGAAHSGDQLRGSVQELLGTVGDGAPKFDIATAAIQRSVDAIKRYDAEVRSGLEPPTREAADKIVGDIDKAVKAIGELPVAQRQAQQSTLQELSALREHYQQFTTEYLRLQDEQAKAAERTAKKEADLLRQRDDAWLKLLGDIQKVSNAEDSEAAKKLAGAQADLASKKSRLSQLDNQDTLTPDELNEQEALRRSIGETEAAVKGLQQAEVAQGHAGVDAANANTRAADALEASFRKAIATDDTLRDSIARLGPAGRDALASLLQELVDLQRQGGGTKQQVDDITARIVKLGQDGGVASAHLAERLGLLRDSTRTLRGEMAGLTPEASKSAEALDGVGKSSGTATASVDKMTGSLGHSKEALAEQAAQAHASAAAASTVGTAQMQAAAGLDRSASAARGAATAARLAAAEAKGLGAAVEAADRQARPSFEDIGRGFKELSTDASKALSSVNFKPIEDGFRELSTDANLAVPAVERAARALDAATRAGGVFDLESGKLKSSFAEITNAAGESVAGLVSWGGHVEALPTKDAADKQRDLAAALEKSNADAVAAAGPVEGLAQRLDQAATSGGSVAQVIAKVSDGVNLFGASADGASGHLTTVSTKADQAATSTSGLGEKSAGATEKIGATGTAAATAGEKMAVLSGHTSTAATAATEAQRPMRDLAGAVRDTSQAIDDTDLPGSLQQVQDAATRLSPVASTLALSFDRIAKAKLGEELQTIGDNADTAAEGLDSVAASLTDLAGSDLEKTSKGVDVLAKAFKALADEMNLSYDVAGKLGARMEQVLILFGKLVQRIAELGAAAQNHI